MAIVDFNTCTWKDTWFRKLPIKAKCLFVFFWTNDHKNLPCLYQLDLETISFYSGLSIKEIKDTLLILYPKVKYDFEKEVVWVVNFVRHQFLRTPNLSPKIKTGIINNLLQMDGHFFIGEFIKEYPMFNLPETYSIDRVSEGYTYPPGGGEGKGKGIKGGVGENKNGLFEKFYQVYPKKRSKGTALKAWGKISPPPDEQLVAQMVATIERVKTSEEWQKDSGKYIPHPATWLNAQGWLDEIEKPKSPLSISGDKDTTPPRVCGNCNRKIPIDSKEPYCDGCLELRKNPINQKVKELINNIGRKPQEELRE